MRPTIDNGLEIQGLATKSPLSAEAPDTNALKGIKMRNKTKGIIAGVLTLGTLTAVGLSATSADAQQYGGLDKWAIEELTKLHGAPISETPLPGGCELMQISSSWQTFPSAPPFAAGEKQVWRWSYAGLDMDSHYGRDLPKWKLKWFLCPDGTVTTTTT